MSSRLRRILPLAVCLGLFPIATNAQVTTDTGAMATTMPVTETEDENDGFPWGLLGLLGLAGLMGRKRDDRPTHVDTSTRPRT